MVGERVPAIMYCGMMCISCFINFYAVIVLAQVLDVLRTGWKSLYLTL